MNPRSKRNQVRPAHGRTALWHPTHLGVRPLVRAMAACSMLTFWTGGPQAQGLPSGMNTVAGQVSAKTNGNALTVTNSPNAIINWKSFSVGAQNSVRFDQVNSSSKVLNRVTGSDPSSILGSLSSNGHVWLLNQNGVLFGQGARVNVAGLVASTLNMSDTNWLLGRHQFSLDGKAAADVVNQGELRTTLGGQIILVGGSVRNEGVIDAPGGQAILAAGSSVELFDTTTPNIGVRISSSPGQVVNLGQLSAAGGRVDIQAAIINQDGIVRADSLARGPAGEIVMRASERLTLAPNSVTSANGDTGGKLTLDADRNMVSGTVVAKGDAGTGGQVKLLGREVGLLDAAHVDVSGQRGGGEVLVGGGQQGKDPAVPNAQAVYVGPQASISADAIDSGNGGRVILWSDRATRAFGTFSARGGASGGDGGFIETSGGWLDARPSRVDTSAPMGRSGTWLLDPYNVSIIDSGSNSGITPPDFTATADNTTILTSTLESALIDGTQVVVSTGGSSGAQAGNITMNAAHIDANAGPGASLTLIADGDIAMTNGSRISIFGNSTPIALLAGRSGAGSINIDTSNIQSDGGDITLGGFGTAPGPFGGQIVNAAASNSAFGVRVNSSGLTSNGGAISIRGISQATLGYGVSIVQSELIGVDLQVQGSATANLASGVDIFNSYILADRNLSINGLGDIRGVRVVDNGGVTAFGSTPQLWVLPPSSAGFLSIGGESLATSGTGVFGVDIQISGQHFSNPAIASWNTGGVSVDGNSSASAGTAIRIGDNFVSGVSAPTITAGTGFLRIGAQNANTFGAVELDGVSLATIGSQAIRIAGQYSVSLNNSVVETGGPISIDSNRQILVSNSQLSSMIAGNPITLDSSQSISVANTQIVSTGGDIRLAGYTLQSGPSGTPDFAAAVATSGTGIGVGISSSFIDAQGGDISIGGASFLSGGFGVAVTQSSVLYGTNIRLQGGATSAGGTGVEIDSSTLVANESIVVLGLGDATGVRMRGQHIEGDIPMLQVSPSGPGPSPFLQIYGEGRAGGSIGTDIDARLATTVPIVATGGASVQIDGLSPGTAIRIVASFNAPDPTVDVFGGGALTVGDASADAVLLDSAWLRGDNTITMTAANSLVLQNNAIVQAEGEISIHSQSLQTSGFSYFESASQALNAIVLSGVGNNPMSTWSTTDPLTVLDALNSRWLAFLTDVTVTSAYPSGVPYAFKLYNGLPGSSVPYAGNGLVFSVPQFATLTGTVQTKTYDATTTATVTNLAASAVNGDVNVLLSISGADFNTGGANAGILKDVTLNDLTLEFVDTNGKPVYGYTPNHPLLRGGIVPAPVTIAVGSLDKVYDATTLANPVATVTGGLVGSETLGVLSSAQFPVKDVGSYVVPVDITLTNGSNGGLADNYSFAPNLPVSADITPKTVTVSGVTAANKAYDGTTAALLVGGSLSGLVGSETLTLGSTGQFDTKDAGIGKTVTGTVTLADGSNGGLASNYTLPGSSSITTSADIDPKMVTVSGVTAANKVYDGTTAASLAGGSVSGLVGSETLTLGSTGQFDTKDAGIGKTVTGVATLGDGTNGGLASNYTLPGSSSITTSADIDPKMVTVSGVTAANKVYDGTTAASLAGGSVSGLVGSETLTLGSTGQFDTKDAGIGKTVTGVATLGDGTNGGLASNYTLPGSSSITTSADIDPKMVTVSGVTAANKVYDGTTAASLAGGSVSGLVGSETLTLGSTGQFDTKDAGIGKTVTGVATLGDGTNGGLASNYILLQPSGLFADISRATLQYVADPATGIFGQPPPAFSGSVSGFKGADSVVASTTGTLGFTSDANGQSPAGSYAVIGGGLSATNYTFEQALTNQAAFTVVNPPAGVPFTAAKEGPTTATDVILTSVIEPRTLITGPTGGLLDLSTTAAPTSTRAAAGNTGSGGVGAVTPNLFQAVDVASQSQAVLGNMLVARDAYKQSLFTQATTELETNPGVADVRPCLTLKEIESGSCMLTESQKREWLAAAAEKGKISAPVPDAAKPAAAPASDGATAKSGVRQDEPEVAFAQPSEALAVSAPYDALLGSKRRVVVAALPQIERKVAIVMGVDIYKDPAIPALGNSVKDARAFGQLLESQLGYETVVLENPSKQEVVAALNKVALAMTANDSVIIYYAGHGWVVQSTGLGYWQLADSDAKQPQTWLSNADLGKMVALLGATQVALISDSCYSGSLVSNERIRAATKAVDPSEMLAQRTVVVMSSGGNEPVFDSGKNGHSPFAWSLMSTLGDLSNWQAGGNVFERVRFAVAKELPQRPQYGSFANAGGRAGGDYLFERRQLEAEPQ